MKTMIEKSLNYVIKNVEKSLAKKDKNAIESAIASLMKAEKIFIFGIGRSGLMGKAFAMRLMHLGLRTYVIGETIAPAINKNDVVFLISGSGETKAVVKIAKLTKEIGATIIAVVGSAESHVAKLADIKILISFDVEKKTKSELAPLGTLFEDTTLLFLDALVVEIMKRTGESEESMSARHATLE